MAKNDYKLDTPFYALAPMAGISTYPFAKLCSDLGADLVFTPMLHTDYIKYNFDEALKVADFVDIDNYIIQLVGSEPKSFEFAIKKLDKHVKPLGYDLNMGCPDKNIVKSGCGGALIKDYNLATDIIKTMKNSTEKPISVKTRAGFDNYDDIFKFIEIVNNTDVSLLTIHPRKVTQMYRSAADWDTVSKIKKLTSIPVCGSGDIRTWQKAIERQKETGADGIMIGRGALGRPWIFEEIVKDCDIEYGLSDLKEMALDISQRAVEIFGGKSIIELRKHYAWFFRDFPKAKTIRMKLMQAESLKDVEKVLKI